MWRATAAAPVRVSLVSLVVAVTAISCARPDNGPHAAVAAPHSPREVHCEQLGKPCSMPRLPSVLLRPGQPAPTPAPLGLLTQSQAAIVKITPDGALQIAWEQDPHPDASAVQVILGATDPSANWASEHPIIYNIRWVDTCTPIEGPPGASLPPCYVRDWYTSIDAATGEFIVGGN